MIKEMLIKTWALMVTSEPGPKGKGFYNFYDFFNYSIFNNSSTLKETYVPHYVMSIEWNTTIS